MNYLISILILILIYIGFFPETDIFFSNFFFDSGRGKFAFHNSMPLKAFSFLVNSVFLLVFALSAAKIFISLVKDKLNFEVKIFTNLLARFFPATQKQAFAIFLTIVIAPVILVNIVGKPLWERARPHQVEDFSGDKIFTPFYQANTEQSGRAFPSGHTSRAASLISLMFIFSALVMRKKAFAIMFTFALCAGFCRILQGNHYLSDVSASLLICLVTIKLVERFLLSKNFEGAQANKI